MFIVIWSDFFYFFIFIEGRKNEILHPSSIFVMKVASFHDLKKKKKGESSQNSLELLVVLKYPPQSSKILNLHL
jgi:hypothetical protein